MKKHKMELIRPEQIEVRLPEFIAEIIVFATNGFDDGLPNIVIGVPIEENAIVWSYLYGQELIKYLEEHGYSGHIKVTFDEDDEVNYIIFNYSRNKKEHEILKELHKINHKIMVLDKDNS